MLKEVLLNQKNPYKETETNKGSLRRKKGKIGQIVKAQKIGQGTREQEGGGGRKGGGGREL